MRRALQPLVSADQFLVRRIATLPHGPVDQLMQGLSSVATKGKLWLAMAAAGAAIPSRISTQPRRAALRGTLALGLASATTNILLKRLLPRNRPQAALLPIFRFAHPQPTSSSLPSGHSASAMAFVTAVATVNPLLGAILAPVALGVAYSRVHIGAHWPSDVVLGSVIGVACGLTVRTWFPPHGQPPAARVTPVDAPQLPRGRGLSVLVNQSSGSFSEESVRWLRSRLPEALISERQQGQSVAQALEAMLAIPGVKALGTWGGDGTVGAVADRALSLGLPLAVFPGGTFNHFARDVHADDAEAVLSAITEGRALAADAGCIELTVAAGTSTRIMMNTASVGIYPELVRRRKLLEGALGKTLAGIIAGLRTFTAATPICLRLNGRQQRVWLVYVGRGHYYPRGFAPLERPVLDDGEFDLRVISAGSAFSFSQLRLLYAIVTGRTEVSSVISLSTPRKITLSAAGEPFDLAVDGEVIRRVSSAAFSVLPRALVVYSAAVSGPAPVDSPSVEMSRLVDGG
ncbi:phosphatase PAP2 family protein [Acaricomes phytoseiuli]|uniref:bifunctional phosphatase PAP2/diacylglycerol kinase family protein n=1 Tax=Acaricomes phytoseiuli TaxID=291968 RepID=UPI000A00EF1E|nr:bifunctional phosphatase PAP2/diacylglycerol kinase family protein [Acaricomes phytoseiuli]MCW1248642.1 phosphatase PAP2 family protein [Acaricomes phytoseiuli]